MGGGMGDLCSARLISFDINLKTTDFKRNSVGHNMHEYMNSPPPPINALATALVKKITTFFGIFVLYVS